MITGLDTFGEYFSAYRDRYVLIGGAALWLLLDEAGLEARATKDLDIVLCLESLDQAFGKAFWKFIDQGGYQIGQQSTGVKQFYRFSKPSVPGYPVMLELFCRQPDNLVLPENSHLTPISVGEEVSSLSAILLDDDYYGFLHDNTTELQGVSVLNELGMIPLKARAWLDLSARRQGGDRIDGRDIKKHCNDIWRLFLLLGPDLRVRVPAAVKTDLVQFFDVMETQLTGQLLGQLGIRDTSPQQVIETLRSIYSLND